MCYKDEVQKKNAEKLQRKFEEDNVPKFIRDYFSCAFRIISLTNFKSVIFFILF